MIDKLCQVAILIFCLGSIYLANDPKPNVRRWACVSGLISEPFWFYTTAHHDQWGIFVSAFFYTAAWGRGFYHTWVKKS